MFWVPIEGPRATSGEVVNPQVGPFLHLAPDTSVLRSSSMPVVFMSSGLLGGTSLMLQSQKMVWPTRTCSLTRRQEFPSTTPLA
jgi:hypothetical protein